MTVADPPDAGPLSGQDRAAVVDEQRATPLLSAARREARSAAVRAHCPGHQGGLRVGQDVAELLGEAVLAADVWLPTRRYDRARRGAEELAARAWRARRAWLLGNGSTAGNLAWLLGTLTDGEPVLVARDAHTSVLAGLVLSGARPVWVPPRMHPELGLPLGVEPQAVAAALRAEPAARQVVLGAPGYAGTAPDLPAVVAAARAHGARVYVDQAWGAHLAFAGAGLPPHALDVGALGAVVSVHKTGTALSSGAVLLAGPDADDDLCDRIDRAVRMTQTTSPLLPLLASVDGARRDLALAGPAGVRRAVRRAARLAADVARIEGLRVVGPDELGLPADRVDPLKLVVEVSGLGVTGWTVEAALRRAGAPPEGADDRRVYAVLAGEVAGSFAAALERVAEAFRSQRAGQRPDGLPSASGSEPGSRAGGASALWQHLLVAREQVMTPRQAHAAPDRAVPLARAVGRIAAEPVVPYPPGVPALLPGERVDADVVDLLRAVPAHGGHLHGCADPALGTLRVVA